MKKKEILKALKDRESFLSNKYPNRNKCAIPNCKLVVDQTISGDDTLCPYHRLLVDFWFYELDGSNFHPDLHSPKSDPDIESYRKRYNTWIDSLSEKEKDNIVCNMGQYSINWEV